jgi:hypothetical protein
MKVQVFFSLSRGGSIIGNPVNYGEVEIPDAQSPFDAFLEVASKLIRETRKDKDHWFSERLYFELHNKGAGWKYGAEALVDGQRVTIVSPLDRANALAKEQSGFYDAVKAIDKIIGPFEPLLKTRIGDLKASIGHFQFLRGFAEGYISELEKDRAALMALHEERMTTARAIVTKADAQQSGDWEEVVDDEEEEPLPSKRKPFGKK